MRQKTLFSTLLLLAILLNGCSAMQKLNQKYHPQSTVNSTKVAATWQADLPHAGSTVHLTQFWQQFNDALLIELIEAAQNESATFATAKSRIAQARFNRT